MKKFKYSIIGGDKPEKVAPTPRKKPTATMLSDGGYMKKRPLPSLKKN